METINYDETSGMHGNTGGVKDFKYGMGYRCIYFKFSGYEKR